MRLGEQGLNLIKQFEGIRHKAYLCPANVPTIGYGTTIYPNGTKVSLQDKVITEQEATAFLLHDVSQFETAINKAVVSEINQNQFDALVSFVYNLGIGNFNSSTLLKKINKNPQDPTIRNEFLKWNKAKGNVLSGLTRRRIAEANLYTK